MQLVTVAAELTNTGSRNRSAASPQHALLDRAVAAAVDQAVHTNTAAQHKEWI
jgi:hypothetical protein